jgi:hypothetical protein
MSFGRDGTVNLIGTNGQLIQQAEGVLAIPSLSTPTIF